MMFKTPQEEFWASDFGNEYIERNKGSKLLASNLSFFSKALKQAGTLNNAIEFGANIGMNLRALKLLYPDIELWGVEINEKACDELAEIIGSDNVICGSVFDIPIEETYELAMVKGVLIHLNPDMLPIAYEKLYKSSEKYILIAEYYNPRPVTIPYRGFTERLFKRDFAGEFLAQYPDTTLVDYGFVYRNDPAFPQDDITWFLIEKQ